MPIILGPAVVMMREIVRWLDAICKNNLSDRNLTPTEKPASAIILCVADDSFHGRLAILFPE
jgi:hypothetical protein